MNIFFLHLVPSICALYHCNKHVVKMILETTQLLCSSHLMTDSIYIPMYKLTHKNHPCSVWVRESLSNYIWLISLGKELCKEYTYRYKKIHKCQNMIEELGDNLPQIPDLGFTSPAQAMPDMYKDEGDVVMAYRTYYYFDKNYLLSWKERNEPEWVTEFTNMFIL
jgi:hypothetical protein